MKEFTIIVRNRNTGKLTSLIVKSDNMMSAVTNCMNKLSGKGNFECMYKTERVAHIKKRK